MKHIILSFIAIALAATSLHAQETKKADPLTLEVFEQKLKQSSSPQILDVRSPEEFAENHLEGAINFYTQDDASFAKAVVGINKKKPVFVYSINNGRSSVVTKKLKEAGFIEVYPLPGGLAHWIGAGKPIVTTSTTKGVTIEEYDKLIASNDVVLVDVGSKHCGGCKKLAPIVDEIATEQASSLKVIKIELYDNRDLGTSLNIESLPTLILYRGNKPVWTKNGTITKADIQNALNKVL